MSSEAMWRVCSRFRVVGGMKNERRRHFHDVLRDVACAFAGANAHECVRVEKIRGRPTPTSNQRRRPASACAPMYMRQEHAQQ